MILIFLHRHDHAAIVGVHAADTAGIGAAGVKRQARKAMLADRQRRSDRKSVV